MIVISDTSAITNLFQIGEIGLLKKLYVEIIIPHAVKVDEGGEFFYSSKVISGRTISGW